MSHRVGGAVVAWMVPADTASAECYSEVSFFDTGGLSGSGGMWLLFRFVRRDHRSGPCGLNCPCGLTRDKNFSLRLFDAGFGRHTDGLSRVALGTSSHQRFPADLVLMLGLSRRLSVSSKRGL